MCCAEPCPGYCRLFQRSLESSKVKGRYPPASGICSGQNQPEPCTWVKWILQRYLTHLWLILFFSSIHWNNSYKNKSEKPGLSWDLRVQVTPNIPVVKRLWCDSILCVPSDLVQLLTYWLVEKPVRLCGNHSAGRESWWHKMQNVTQCENSATELENVACKRGPVTSREYFSVKSEPNRGVSKPLPGNHEERQSYCTLWEKDICSTKTQWLQCHSVLHHMS